MFVNLYLILSLIFSGVGLTGTSSYFDKLASINIPQQKLYIDPHLAKINLADVYAVGVKNTGLEPNVKANGAIAYDIDNSQILFKLNDETKLPMASLTKIMTATVALENIHDLNKVVTISRNAALVEGSKMNVWIDEKITIKDLLYGLILKSGNDAAVALQEYYDNEVINAKTKSETDIPVRGAQIDNNNGLGSSGTSQDGDVAGETSPKTFLELMNDKAQFLDMKNTKYLDSSGINESNITTARDLSVLTNYAMRNATFRQIIGTVQYTAQAVNGSLVHNMTTTNRLLRTRSDVLAGKTGYSEAAGWNMITLFKAPSSGHRIVTVVMGTEGNDARFNESNRIIDWVYTSYRW